MQILYILSESQIVGRLFYRKQYWAFFVLHGWCGQTDRCTGLKLGSSHVTN